MNKAISESTSDKQYFVLFETDDEGVRQYKTAPEKDRIGTSLSEMRVEGKIVPAIKMKVDKATYDSFKRDQWMEEYRYRQENRCIIGGANGKSDSVLVEFLIPTTRKGNLPQKALPTIVAIASIMGCSNHSRAKLSFPLSLSPTIKETRIRLNPLPRIQLARPRNTVVCYMDTLAISRFIIQDTLSIPILWNCSVMNIR